MVIDEPERPMRGQRETYDGQTFALDSGVLLEVGDGRAHRFGDTVAIDLRPQVFCFRNGSRDRSVVQVRGERYKAGTG